MSTRIPKAVRLLPASAELIELIQEATGHTESKVYDDAITFYAQSLNIRYRDGSPVVFGETLTTTEAAEYLGIKPRALQNLKTAGKIPSVKVDGKSNAFRIADLDEYQKQTKK